MQDLIRRRIKEKGVCGKDPRIKDISQFYQYFTAHLKGGATIGMREIHRYRNNNGTQIIVGVVTQQSCSRYMGGQILEVPGKLTDIIYEGHDL